MRMKPGEHRVLVVHPDNPDQEVPAYLCWDIGNTPSLKFDLPPFPKWLDDKRIERLFVVSPEPATLFNLLGYGSPFGSMGEIGSISEAPCHWALFGGKFSQEDALFETIRVYVDGCGHWFGKDGFAKFEGWHDLDDGLTITYKDVETTRWSLPHDWAIGYGVGASLHFARQDKEGLRINESHFIEVHATTPQQPDILLREATKALAFLEFSMDAQIKIERVFLERKSEEGSVEFAATWKQNSASKSVGYHWIIPFATVKANLEEHLARWFELYEALPLALDLYRECERSSSLQVEFRLFSIISALESLHRSLFGEGDVTKCPSCKRKITMSLEQRLRDIVDRHGESIQKLLLKADCKLVADTRNYLAHQSPELKAKAIPSDDWFYWYRRLTAVFEICILAELPFAHTDAFKNIISNRWAAINSGSLGDWKF